MKVFVPLLCLLFHTGLSAQVTDTAASRYFSLGSKRAGICFGNASRYTGIRFNLIDKNVRQVHLLNFGLLTTGAEKSNGLALSLFLNYDSISNGLSFAGLMNHGRQRNGIALSGLITNGKKINGIGMAGIAVAGDTLNGLFFALYFVAHGGQQVIKRINGFSATLVGVVGANEINGVSVSGFGVRSKKFRGLSVSGWMNETEDLKGVQIGLLNYAGNNRKLFRWMPFINMHFGK